MIRRRFLVGAAASVVAVGFDPRRAAAARRLVYDDPAVLDQGPPMLNEPRLLVAGPADSVSGRWATLLAPGLTRAMALPQPLPITDTGGQDGVTGANAFDALTAPDGATAMLVPGTAAIAWLAGDPRVHFDAGRWVPALAAFAPGVVIGRRPPGGRLAGRPVRIAASTSTGVELPALLGLFLLGAVPVPAFGLSDPGDAEIALRSGRVDAIMLSGTDVPARLARLRSAGFAAYFAIPGGGSVTAGTDQDEDVPDLMALLMRHPGSDPALVTAWRATAAAAAMQTALVLPLLAPPAVTARWRQASDAAVAGVAPDGADGAIAGAASAAAVQTVRAGETAQLALRRWLAERSNWRHA